MRVSVNVRESGGHEPVGPHADYRAGEVYLFVPRVFDFVVRLEPDDDDVQNDPEHPAVWASGAMVFRDGRYRLVRLVLETPMVGGPVELTRFGGGEIDASTLRRLRVGELARAATAEIRVAFRISEDEPDAWSLESSEAFAAHNGARTVERRLVVAYLIAQVMGEDTTKAVAAELGISPQAAAQRISRARRAGLLAPTTRGRRKV